jgi:hypothetical protein
MAETIRSDADAARIIFAAILMAIYGFGLRESADQLAAK